MSKMELHSQNRSSLNEEPEGAVRVSGSTFCLSWLTYASAPPSPPGWQSSFPLFFLGLVDTRARPPYSSVSLMLGHMTSLATEIFQIPCLQILKNIHTVEVFLLHCCLAIGRFWSRRFWCTPPGVQWSQLDKGKGLKFPWLHMNECRGNPQADPWMCDQHSTCSLLHATHSNCVHNYLLCDVIEKLTGGFIFLGCFLV